MAACDKAALRRRVRASYPGKAQRDRESEEMCACLMAHPVWRTARVVGAYMPMPREADVMPLMLDALASGKTLVLPRVGSDGTLSLRQVRDMAQLEPGAYGILEPPATLPTVATQALDLLIVPLEALDKKGMRLGKGGGYYDRLLADAPCRTVGAVMSWQWTEQVPADLWDRPLDMAMDYQGITLFKQERND